MRKPRKQSSHNARARRLRASVLALSAVSIAGCANVPGDGETVESASSEANAAAVQIAMTKANEDFPEGVVDSIARDQILGEATPKIGGTISRSLREGLMGEAGAQQFYAPIKSGGVVRIDAYALKADVSPFQVNVGGKELTFPLSTSAGSRIEFAQMFSSQAAAASAPRPPFGSVPADAERSLALKEGTYVTIPLHGEIATTASGTFLSRAASFSGSLAGLLRSSARGSPPCQRDGAAVLECVLLLLLHQARGRAKIMNDAPLYPLFLKLEGRPVVVAGAGAVGSKKIADLVAAGARVHVVSPEASEEVQALAASGVIRWTARAFEARDVAGAFLIVTATNSADAQRIASEAGEQAHTFVLAVDDIPNASAYGASVIRRPPFTVAISSSGRAPALSRLLREIIDEILPSDSWVARAEALRAQWRREATPIGDRFAELVRAFKKDA